MGIDLNLYVVADPTDEQLAVAETFIRRAAPIAEPHWNNGVALERTTWNGEPAIELYSLSRLFDPHYPRGWWPGIFQSVKAMEAAFPGCVVHYGDDCHDPDYGHAAVADEQFIEECWAAWNAKQRPGHEE